MKGYIHSFETFGTVDGPGIRFVAFMQGCPLKCKYCHNRDTWEIGRGKQYEVSEILDKVLRCKPYIESSNGGFTASGGEPLLQSKFLTEVFKKLKENNIHTALDTAGSLPIEQDEINCTTQTSITNKTTNNMSEKSVQNNNDTNSIKELLKYTDLVILDIKHIDEEKCINLTGMSNKNELNFARYCSEHGIKMWIRQVLVPGYTDDEADLKKTRKFIDTLQTVEKVEVLPYHDLGKFKWNEMGLEYPLEGVKSPTEEQIKKAEEILEK